MKHTTPTLKQVMRFTLCVVWLGLALTACSKREATLPIGEKVCHCGTDDALQDLEWLHDLIVAFEANRDRRDAEVCICKYDGGKDGFLFTDCMSCPDRGMSFVDCQGRPLGLLFGIDGRGYEYFNIDPASVRTVYTTYMKPTLTGKVWRLKSFVDRRTRTTETPTFNGRELTYWIVFNEDGTLTGGGVNQLTGSYAFIDDKYLSIKVHTMTEIYDGSGWEDRMLEALNAAVQCDVGAKSIRIYFHDTATYMEFVATE